MSDATANALREARRSLADLVTALPEPVWREHEGVFENAVDLMVGENLNMRADNERLGAALAAAESERDRANSHRGALIQTQRRLTKRATAAEKRCALYRMRLELIRRTRYLDTAKATARVALREGAALEEASVADGSFRKGPILTGEEARAHTERVDAAFPSTSADPERSDAGARG